MFKSLDFDVIDEVNIGTGTKLRLIQTHKGSKRIESWSNLSKQWNVMYRYNVEEAWASWKKTAAGIDLRKPEKKKPARKKAETKVEEKAKTKAPAKKPVKKRTTKAKAPATPAKKPTTRRKKNVGDGN